MSAGEQRQRRGWKALIDDSDEEGPRELVFYCPGCARREFGDRD